MTHLRFALLASSLALSACATTPTAESDFGKSVEKMQISQTLNPDTRANPSDAPVIGADPYVVNSAVEAMRKDVPKREEVKKDVVVNVNSQK